MTVTFRQTKILQHVRANLWPAHVLLNLKPVQALLIKRPRLVTTNHLTTLYVLPSVLTLDPSESKI